DNTSYIYGNGSIYVDGVSNTASNSYRATHTDRNGNTLKIGFPRSSNDDYFSGKIDEVRIWNKALSASEIADNFTRTVSFTGEETNLVAYYNFQSNSIDSSIVNDRSGNGYDLTLVNGAITGLASNLAIDRDDNIVFLAENSADGAAVKVADITIIDNTYSTDDLVITGEDADKFSISGTEILLNAGATFDYETDGELNFTTEFGDDSIEAAESITVTAIDVLELTNTVTVLDENTDTTERIQVAQLDLTEAALSSNTINLTGDDADYFEVEDFVLYLKAGTNLDFETQATYNVTVELDDVVDSTVDAAVDFTLTVNDVNDAPTAINLTTDSTNYTANLFLSGNENYIETNAEILDFSSDFTIEAWIQTTANQGGIFAKNNGDSRAEAGEKSFYINNGGELRFFSYGDGVIDGNTEVNDGKLHHVSLVWDSVNGEGYIYVDGVLDANSNLGTLDSDESSHTVKIGAPNFYDVDQYFEGFLGNVWIWDIARTQEEILAGLSTTLIGTETGLVANYNNFNSDRTNTTITDTTGNYNGTLIGYNATLAKIALPENLDTTSSIKLTEFTLADQDPINTNQVTITGDYSDRFELVTTGERSYELYLAAGSTIDYETTPEIEINIEVSDSDLDNEAIIAQTFTVVVANQNEAPSVALEYTITELDENTPTDERIQVAEIDIIDEDDNDNLNLLTLTGDDAAYFALDNNKVYLQAGTTLDYESKTQFDVTVELDDPTFDTGVDDSVDLSVAIKDVNDAPSLIVTNNNDNTRVLSLDGGSYEDGDYVGIDSELLDLDADYTFEAWFKTSQRNRGIFIKGDDDGNLERGEKALYLNRLGWLEYRVQDPFYESFFGVTNVADGEWHHVAFVLDQREYNNTAYIYLDGNLLAQETDTGLDYPDNEGDTIKIGTWDNSLFFDGEMRDIRFWNTTRSQTEIQSNLNTQLTGTESGLVAYYNLSNNSDTQLIDQTGNGIDGTLVDDARKIDEMIISEDTEIGSNFVIADFAIEDEDNASEFLDNSLSLSGADSEFFEIVENKLYFKADTILDYETKTQYNFSVDLSDDTYSDNSVNFEIGITNVNEVPILTLESVTSSIAETTDTSSRIKVANLFISDDSEAQDITLTGDDADKFEVVSNNDDFYNFEIETEYDSETPNFSIDNIDISFTTDTSSALKVADLTIADGSGITDFILSGDDEDSFEIVNGNELYLIAGVTIDADTTLELTVEANGGVDPETGSLSVALSELDADVKELYLKANEILDYETNPQLDVTIEVSDGEYSDTASYSLVITDVDETPIFTLENIVESIKENTDTTGGYKIADLSISDDDANDNTITISGDDADKFEIISNSELYLIDGTVLDYETQTEYNIAVTVSDITNSTSVDHTLEIINQIENPLTISFVNTIDDNGDAYGWGDGVFAESRDLSERVKIADVVITGGEGNEIFTLTELDADDFEIEGNTIYLKAGTDLTQYGDGEGIAEFKVNVDGSDINEDGSDTFKYFALQIISPELEIGYDDYRTYLAHENTFTLPDTVDVASGSIEYELELFNWGFDTLAIENISITGTHSSDFNIVGNPSFSLYMESETSEFITFGFDPSSGGELSATLEISSNDGEENPYIVYLTGTGIGSEINVLQGETDYSNGDSQDFGILEIDTATSQQTFTITNKGTEALSISDVVITGANADEFTTDFSVSEIAAGASAELTVNFTPTAGGDRSAILTINNNDDDESAFAINLTGNGAIAEIDLVQGDTELPSGTTQDFGSVNIDSGEIQQTFTIQNTGTKTLNIGEIAVTGTNASYFILENSSAIANTAIAAGDSKDLTITFNPRTIEKTTAILTINSDDNDESAYIIEITGTGTDSITLEGSNNDDNIDNEDGNTNVDAGNGDDTVTGNDADEHIRGGKGSDQVYGEDGSDQLYGNSGDDVIVGGTGQDLLRGGAENDIMFGGDGDDKLYGGQGDDTLYGDEGSDKLYGGQGNDTFVLTADQGIDIVGDFVLGQDEFTLVDITAEELSFEATGNHVFIKVEDKTIAKVLNITTVDLQSYFDNTVQGYNVIEADSSDNLIEGTNDRDYIYTNNGNDTVNADSGDDVIKGQNGDDSISGSDGDDLIFGNNDNDTLLGDAGSDLLYGGNGNDYLDGGEGNDSLNGGSDSDTFVLRSGNGVDTIFNFNVDEDQFELIDLTVDNLTFEDSGSHALIKFGSETLAKVRNVTALNLEDYFTNKYNQ
ncbi:MAG: LamG-like jellyroll fold domain-containing protein, partial [Cyanobacteria bacterium P01_F01_bin.143]